MEAYEQVQKGPLKLKGVAELGVTKRKKKKKDKDKAKMLEAIGTQDTGLQHIACPTVHPVDCHGRCC
ncbi:RIKEN cDNA 2510049I19, isoform CRA_b [Mus musculus]|nr:RIKEN cDNA 2510049I19, isoform CRA_b [Mus musculus]